MAISNKTMVELAGRNELRRKDVDAEAKEAGTGLPAEAAETVKGVIGR